MNLLNPWGILVGVLLLIGAFTGGVATGYDYRSGEVAKRDLAVATQQEKDREAFTKRESNIGELVEKKLAEFQASPQTLEIHREIIKPVFRNVCVSDDYVRLFNDRTKAAIEAIASEPAR